MTTILTGKVFSGMQVAFTFVKKITEQLGANEADMRWYPGTLNIRLDEPFATPETAVVIKKESYGGKGDVSLIPVLINNTISGFIARSTMTLYADTVAEIVSETNLRDALHLADGDTITFNLV